MEETIYLILIKTQPDLFMHLCIKFCLKFIDHIHILKYFKPDDAVIIIDADDSLMEKQVLNILNYKYKNPECWIVYSRFLMNS